MSDEQDDSPDYAKSSCSSCGFVTDDLVPYPRSECRKTSTVDGPVTFDPAYWTCVLCRETGLNRFPLWDFPVWDGSPKDEGILKKASAWPWSKRDVSTLRATVLVGNAILAELRKR